MESYSGTFRVLRMSRVLKVSRSGFYAWRKRQSQPSPKQQRRKQQRRKQLDEGVKKAFEEKKGRSGSPGLTRDLADAGQHYDRKTVAESMRHQGLRAKAAKKFKATTNSKHDLPVAPNRLQQNFTATAPNQKYVSAFAPVPAQGSRQACFVARPYHPAGWRCFLAQTNRTLQFPSFRSTSTMFLCRA